MARRMGWAELYRVLFEKSEGRYRLENLVVKKNNIKIYL
jgi:hypothetical protein